MSRVLIIGCGGVANVAIRKCCQASDIFTEICIASRTKSKCDALAESLKDKTATKITTAQVDADSVDELISLIKAYQPELVMNIALPYQDLTIMDACLACGVNYMDTANYEPEDTDDPKWRAIYEKRHSLAAALTRVLHRLTAPMPKSMNLTQLIPLIFWTATAATTAMPLPRTSTRKSTCVRFPLRAAILKTANGLKFLR